MLLRGAEVVVNGNVGRRAITAHQKATGVARKQGFEKLEVQRQPLLAVLYDVRAALCDLSLVGRVEILRAQTGTWLGSYLLVIGINFHMTPIKKLD